MCNFPYIFMFVNKTRLMQFCCNVVGCYQK